MTKPNLFKLAAAAALAAVIQAAPVTAQDYQVQRVGLVGGARSGDVAGPTLSGGAMLHTGSLTLTFLGEGLFHNGRPDERFQEIPVSTVYPDAPLVEVEENLCQDPDTDEVFARGKCQVGKAQLRASLDLGVARAVAGHEVLLGAGYRLGSRSEPYAVLAVSGRVEGAEGSWLARVDVSRRSLGLKVGYVIG